MSETLGVYTRGTMNGNELLKKLKKLAKERNVKIDLVRKRGKGSHSTLYFGGNKTIMKDRKKEIGEGLLRQMLKDLEIDENDL